jgi:Ca-activated chloride channel family protein
MRFSTPEFFFGFVAVALLLLLFYYSARKRRRLLSLFADRELLSTLTASFSPSKRKYKRLFIFLGLIFLVLCLTRPQLGTHMMMLKREGQDVVIAIDVSNSMLAEDMKPNRLEKAKQEVRGIISRMEGDRVGLVAFAGAAFVQCPLTLDYSAAKLFLDVIDVDLISQQGTHLGEALRKATDAFENKRERKHKVVLLITDGEDFGGDLDAAAEYARLEGVKIFCIGIGHPDGEPIPIRNQRGEMVGYKKDSSGELVMSRLDETSLQMVSSVTGGKYYHASAGEIELDRIYDEISAMEKKEQEGRLLTQYEDRYQYFLPIVVFFLALEALISERRSAGRREID